MSIANHLDLAIEVTEHAQEGEVTGNASPPLAVHERPTLSLVDDKLALAEPSVEPNPVWHDAMLQLVSSMKFGIQTVEDRSLGLRQRIKWPWGVQAVPAAPVFAPWLSHACTAFQDPRYQREPSPARWVASYLWDPFCSGPPVKSGSVDVMLISPHPAVCRADEESCASLPGIGLLQDMIGAARAEGRSRVAIVGYARSQNVTARQLLGAKSRFSSAPLDLDVVAIEEALARLAGNPNAWDAIIVLPELRSMVFALLARLTGVGGAWPMVWHGKGLAFVCGETALTAAPNGPLDATLLIQALSLVVRDGGKATGARRLAEGWARLRDRGLVTPSRGSPAPYCMQICDAAMVEELCRQSDLAGRPVPAWKAMSSIGAEENPAVTRPARLELVTDH